MIKIVAKWLDDKFEDAVHTDGWKSYATAFAVGAVEGILDVALVVGVVVMGVMTIKEVAKKL